VKISPAQSDFLNWSRWVAAWLVVAEHARSLVFVDYGELQSPGLWAKGFYFLTGFGHEAVMVFFVISGYLVGGKVWSLYREGRFGWRRYLADRASRLYAVLLVALLLGAALDWSGYLFFNKYGLYNHGYEGSIAVLGTAPIERMGWRDFLVNAFFLQTIAGSTFGSNGPLWSLAYEWWYYILFPGILLVVFRKSLIGLTVGAALTVLLLFVLPFDIIWLFGIWLLGVAAAILPPMVERRSADSGGWRTEGIGENRKVESGNRQRLEGEKLNEEMAKAKFGRMFFGVSAVLLFLGILVLARVEVLKVPYAWQYLLGFAYALVILSLANGASRLPLARSSAYLADFSYSVYLIHFPVLLFVLSVGFESFGFGIRGPFSLAGLVWYIGVIGIAIFVSWIVSLFTEARTASLRAVFYKLFWVGVR
jgi:peptidoglycan/LPS O-acetylase OafA/YrhL